MKWFLGIFLGLVTLHACYCLTFAWNYPLSDWHGFRQTQTAISAYFISNGGPLIAYHTPVLGGPWSIPFEFPFFQWVVVLWEKLTGMNLNQSGRSVSILFFLLCLIPLNTLLRLSKVAPIFRSVFFSLFLCSPFYLFWSRTFLIESTALFFSLTYLASALSWFREPSKKHFCIACVSGALASVVKGTTLAPCLLMILIVGIVWSFRSSRPKVARGVLWMGSFIILPLFCAWLWTRYSDFLKLQVPLAAFISSHALTKWNFGLLEQRWSYHLWKEIIYDRATPEILGSIYSLVVICILVPLSGKRILYALLSSFLYILTFLLFSNLHKVHNYYQYAQGIFLLCAFGFVIVGCLERGRYVAWAGALGLMLCLYLSYRGFIQRGFYEVALSSRNSPYVPVGRALNKSIDPEKVLLIYGVQWSSEIPYYARRRAIMDGDNLDLAEPRMQETFRKSLTDEGRLLGAMVVCGAQRNMREFMEPRIKALHLEETPSYTNVECNVHKPIWLKEQMIE